MTREDCLTQRITPSFPAGIIHCRAAGVNFPLDFISRGTAQIFGYSDEETNQLLEKSLTDFVHEQDRSQVTHELQTALEKGERFDFCFRMERPGQSPLWCHLTGHSETGGLCGTLTALPAQFQLFWSIAEETADGIYVIKRDTYELLYTNESKTLFSQKSRYRSGQIGKKCYEVLHGKTEPCSFCTLKNHAPDGHPHQMSTEQPGKFYSTFFKEYEWDGEPVYVKYVRDVTEDVKIQKEKDRLEQYFQTVLKYLPGGTAVVRHEKNGKMVPEFLSAGFAEMVEMSSEEAWALYQQDAMAGVHPEDREQLREQLTRCISEGQERYAIVYRLRKGNGDYIWVKASFSVILSEGGDTRVYVDYHDITTERENARQLRIQYQEQLLQHYLTPEPNVLVLGHCNITTNRILEIDDHTGSGLLETFGTVRESFFRGISTLIVYPEQREDFLDAYLNDPSRAAFERGETEIMRRYFIRLPGEQRGRYAQFRVNLLETPDTGDITGILTVTDVTDQMIRDQILHQLSANSYDLIADVDLPADTYFIVNNQSENEAVRQGIHSEKMARLIGEQVLPREREHVAKMLDTGYMLERLQKEGSYTVSYSIAGPAGAIRAKKLVITAIDLRLGRVCLARTDITDSVREQRGLLNMIAYTFELACFIELDSGILTMYTRDTVLKNLPPYTLSDYDTRVSNFARQYGRGKDPENLAEQFTVKNLLERLEKAPNGYDFVFPYGNDTEVLYKQINVLWGDENKRTICLVRADITDVMEAELRSKEALAQALDKAEKASRAKSEFLSSMSHDIRTPMNAIIGMTTLSLANLGDQEKVETYLKKISFSSKHLLSLINDILDMNKIEQGGINLKCSQLSLKKLVEQLVSMMEPQARENGLSFHCQIGDLFHDACWADSLRINQILINLLGNAIKFTPEGGRILFQIEEVPSHRETERNRYRFTIRDSGIGMSHEFMEHLFEPFTRSSSVASVEGTGLGLSITKGLIDLMGGTIQVESQPGAGTTFVVELEFEPSSLQGEEDCQTQAYDQPDSNSLIGRHFLVVEDNFLNSEILCELLKMYGADSTLKENGLQGVQEFTLAAPGTYDAILMDIQMPVMNGFEATQAIRRLPREDAATIPIVAMTANAFAEDVQAALEAGMDDHIAKPVDMQVLCQSLQRLLKD